MTIILFILVLFVTVLVHEWGHFFAARKSGMRVEEFGFGIPPKLWSKKKGETEYSFNLLPIGGFVRIAGENGIDESVPLSEQFESKPWYKKAFVLVAGVVCNILLAIVLFAVANMIGMPTSTEGGTPTVVHIVPETPASEAGLKVGDKVTSIRIGTKEITPITTELVRDEIQHNAAPVTIAYVRDGENASKTLTPAASGDGKMIGIAIEPIGIAKYSFGESLSRAIAQVVSLVGNIWNTLSALLVGVFTDADTPKGLIGPVGLAKEVGSAATIGFAYLLAFTAAISVNLAVLNILPFPALDGGRLVVVLLEAITRRRFSSKVVGYIHAGGFVLLLALMVILTVGDIRKLL